MRRNSIEKHLEQKHTHNRVTLKVIAYTHFLNGIYRLAINLYIVRCDGIMVFIRLCISQYGIIFGQLGMVHIQFYGTYFVQTNDVIRTATISYTKNYDCAMCACV